MLLRGEIRWYTHNKICQIDDDNAAHQRDAQNIVVNLTTMTLRGQFDYAGQGKILKGVIFTLLDPGNCPRATILALPNKVAPLTFAHPPPPPNKGHPQPLECTFGGLRKQFPI